MVCVKVCDRRLEIMSFLCHLLAAVYPRPHRPCPATVCQVGDFISVLCLMTVIRLLKRITCLRFS